MGAGVLLVLQSLATESFAGFLAAFLLLFVTTGIGNGSTFRMIPAIFREQALARAGREGWTRDEAARVGKREAAAVLGLTSAVGALGGFFIPRGFGASIANTGSVDAALTAFLGFYAGCLTLTWFCYLRRRVLAQRVPSLAHAGV